VKPEVADYLAKARECLAGARTINAVPLPQVAAKEAYLAGYHAAQALIFDRIGKVVKSHSGLRSEFARLTRDDLQIDKTFTRFLARAYKFKEIADYAVGRNAVVAVGDAQEVIEGAARFIDVIARLVDISDSSRTNE
jgi:uncharacterized protein (UPF0332 family)